MGLKKTATPPVNRISDEEREYLLVMKSAIDKLLEATHAINASLIAGKHPEIMLHWLNAGNGLWYAEQLINRIDLSVPETTQE